MQVQEFDGRFKFDAKAKVKARGALVATFVRGNVSAERIIASLGDSAVAKPMMAYSVDDVLAIGEQVSNGDYRGAASIAYAFTGGIIDRLDRGEDWQDFISAVRLQVRKASSGEDGGIKYDAKGNAKQKPALKRAADRLSVIDQIMRRADECRAERKAAQATPDATG